MHFQLIILMIIYTARAEEKIELFEDLVHSSAHGKPSFLSDFTVTFNLSQHNDPVEDYKTDMNAQEIIQAENYPMETHNVTTKDFFNLTIIRIPKPGKIPVYVLHGVIASARDFLVQPRNLSLPFQLHDAGFDVWLGNIRGNTYSSVNLNYTRDDPRYWNFTVDDIIHHDNPTAIDYILEQTRHKKLIWIGWSLGTWSFFGTMALRPDLNPKIIQMVGLAPLISQEYMTSPVRLLSYQSEALPLEALFTFGEFMPELALDLMGMTMPTLCNRNNWIQNISNDICNTFLSSIFGLNGNETLQSVLPVAFAEVPNTVSVYVVSQLLRSVTDPHFRYYDYGSILRNLAVYGRHDPPRYNASNIKVPIILYSGNCDSLVDTRDTDALAAALPCRPRRRYVECFNHVDFVYGRNAPKLYQQIIRDLLTVIKHPVYQAQCKN